MKDKINSYFATLLITIFGAAAALLIVRVAVADTATPYIVRAMRGTEASYAPLKKTLLNAR